MLHSQEMVISVTLSGAICVLASMAGCIAGSDGVSALSVVARALEMGSVTEKLTWIWMGDDGLCCWMSGYEQQLSSKLCDGHIRCHVAVLGPLICQASAVCCSYPQTLSILPCPPA